MDENQIKREFLEEAGELIDDCEAAFHLLEECATDQTSIDRLFRDLHTVKGSAGVTGFESLSKFVHKMEDLVNIYREQGFIPEQSHTILLDSIDWVALWIDKLKNDMNFEPEASDLDDHLNMLKVKENVIPFDPASKQEESGFVIFEENGHSEEALPTVLVVDDETTMLKVLDTYLMDLPIRVLTANSAKQGLELFNTEQIDVIVSDLRMPDMNGIEFISKIRETSQSVEVIFLTAHANKESLEEFIKLRTFGFVDKAEGRIPLTNSVINAMKTKKVQDAVRILTKLNFEIYLDFSLIRSKKGQDMSKIEDRIQRNLEKVAKLSSIVADPELVLNYDTREIA